MENPASSAENPPHAAETTSAAVTESAEQTDLTPPLAAAAIFGDRLPLAVRYHASLATTGLERGFLGPREVPRLWERHILNSALVEQAIPRGDNQDSPRGTHPTRVIDVGSGAGLPGIPLAIARPDLQVTLLEPLLKRSTYLAEIVAELAPLGLTNVQVRRGRAEDPAVVRELGGADFVTSRAVAPLGKLVTWSLPLLKRGGKIVALKGSSVAEEITRDRAVLRKLSTGQPVVKTLVAAGIPATTVVEITRR